MSTKYNPTPSVKHSLDILFHPTSIAHVGASPRHMPGRFSFITYLKSMGYGGMLYPVNPKYDEAMGLKCYPDLASVPGTVDLAIMALPAPLCAGILRGIPEGKVKFVVVHTSGFGEIDKDDLEEELIELAHEKGFRIIGPNCMGIFSQKGKICFWEDQSEFADRPGTVGLISQSGGLSIHVVSGCIDLGIGMDKAVSLGNQIDLSINELLEYMGQDDNIQVISIYVEGVKDGRGFLKSLKVVTPRKPVLVWKGGLTDVGKAASKTHTGSMGGDAEIFTAAMKQAGAILIENFEHMIKTLRLLQPPMRLPGQRLGIVCPGGGNTVSLSDAFANQPNIVIPRLSQQTRDELQAFLPEENVDTKNPVDPGAVGMTKLDQLLRILGKDPQIDSIFMMLTDEIVFHFDNEEARNTVTGMIAALIAEASREIGKPIYAHILHVRDNNEDVFHCRRLMIDKLNEKNIPWTDGSFKEAALAVSRLAGYCKYLERFK